MSEIIVQGFALYCIFAIQIGKAENISKDVLFSQKKFRKKDLNGVLVECLTLMVEDLGPK
jgi:hypothetical protein